jgi:signal transduction histidine kinase/CheY-like chemotaxis protein
MFTSIQLTKNTDPDFRSSVSELFQSTSRKLIYTLAGIYIALLMATAIWPNQIAFNVWRISPATLCIFLLAHWLLPRNYLLAHLVLHLGLAMSITLAIYLFQIPEIAFFYALLPMLSIVCLGWRTGSIMQVLVLGLVYWVNHGLLAVPPSLALSMAVILGGVISGMLGWASMQAVLAVTEWSLYSYWQAQKNLEDTRDHRGQLAHVVKELDSANIRLERANHMLVLARSEAEEAKDARNRFTMAISHELRTPLNFIIGFSELMVSSPATYAPLDLWPHSLYEDIQEIYRSSSHLMKLVNDILDLGQIEKMRMTLIKEWINPVLIIQEVEAMVRPAFIRKALSFEIDLPQNLPEIFVDHTRIRQVILNLVSNSLRYTDHGKVVISARLDKEGEILFSVQDTGIGISQDDIPKIFEDFHQVGNDTWRKREGTGLGIPISRRFIELHGGRLWVESQVGKGTYFYFTLPSSGMQRNPSLGNSINEINERYWLDLKGKAESERILIALSDDPTAGEVLASYVEDYSIITSGIGDELTSRVNELLPIAVLLDQTIADQPEIVAAVQNLPYDLPVICFTFPGNPYHPTNLPEGVLDYLVKPVNSQALVQAVKALGPEVRNLLVVDDDPAMTRFIERALLSSEPTNPENNGKKERLEAPPGIRYLFQTALSGYAALEAIKTSRPDAVLLDLLLPDISGWEVLNEIKPLKIPVILVTAHDWLQQLAINGQNALSIYMRRPLARYELPPILKNLLETIHPTYPPHLNGLTPPTKPSA